MRRERSPQRIDRWVQLTGEMLARIRRDHGGTRRSARAATSGTDVEPAGHSVVPWLTFAPRRRRQRRVGETAWTDSRRKMADRISQVATVLGHRKSRWT